MPKRSQTTSKNNEEERNSSHLEKKSIADSYSQLASVIKDINTQVEILGEKHAGILQHREKYARPYEEAISSVVEKATRAEDRFQVKDQL